MQIESGAAVSLFETASPPTIAVWGNYHGANLGDDLVVEIIINAIRRRAPEARIVAISLAPWDTERRHGVSTFPIKPGLAPPGAKARATSERAVAPFARKLLRRMPGARHTLSGALTAAQVVREVPFDLGSRRILRDIDVVVVAGSGQLLDSWWGPWDHPLTAYRWAILSRLAGTKLLVPSVGAGPIRTRLGAALIRGAIDRASFVSVRDNDSAQVLQAIGVTRPLPIRPDMAFGFPQPEPAAPPAPPDATPRVGVNAMPYEDPRYWPKIKPGRYEAYLGKMATFVADLLGGGYKVSLFSSQTRADRLVADDLITLLGERGFGDHPDLSSQFDSIREVGDLVRAVASYDYVVAGRFHCVLLPLAAGIPTIGLAYHAKTREVIAQMGRPERYLDIDTFEPKALYAALESLRATDGADERELLRRRAAELRAEVEAQFDELFSARTTAAGA
jgi:polysaccharide pyruvyl transferase WcaK-like protein